MALQCYLENQLVISYILWVRSTRSREDVLDGSALLL